MKAVTIFLVMAAIAQLAHADGDLVSKLAARSAIGDKIKQFLESFKETMKTGNESKGIPPMDPFKLIHQEFDVNHELVNAKGEVNDLYVKGLSDFEVKDADFKLAKKNFSIKMFWPRIEGNTLYDLIEAKLVNFIPIFGKGHGKFEITNLTFATNAKLKLDLKNKKVELIEFDNTQILLDDFKLDSTGLYNDDELSEFMSGVISDLVPQTLVDFQSKITPQVNEIMLKVGNQVIPSIADTIWEIIMP